jgi:hypothetical protein
VGLELPGESRNLEMKPYARSGVDTNRQAVPSFTNNPSNDVGIDVKYGVTKGLTADFTVNTDFAQSEQDEQQVNLTRFNVFFPEKRDFFLEGQGIFAFAGIQSFVPGVAYMPIQPFTQAPTLTPIIFFSRQIGLAGGREVPIRAGARLTGNAGRYSIGLLNIETGESTVANAKPTNFSVVRIRRNILRRSTVGVIGTLRPRPDGVGGGGSNGVYGADAVLGLFQNVQVNTYYARSRTPGITREDSSYLGRLDYAADRWGFNVERLAVGKGFNPEIGFLYRQAFQRSFGVGRFSPRPRGSTTIRKLTFEGSVDYITNPDGRLSSRDGVASFRMDMNSGDQWSSAFSRKHEFLERPFQVFTGVFIPPGDYDFQEYRATYYFAPQRKISGTFNFTRGSFYNGDRTQAGYYGRLDLGSSIGLEPRVLVDWVDLPSGTITSKLLGARLGITMTPRMAISSLIQYSSSAAAMASNLRFRWELPTRQRPLRRLHRRPRHAPDRVPRPPDALVRRQADAASSLVAANQCPMLNAECPIQMHNSQLGFSIALVHFIDHWALRIEHLA